MSQLELKNIYDITYNMISENKSYMSWLKEQILANKGPAAWSGVPTSIDLRVHYCRFQTLPICSCSYKDNILKISHSYS